MKRESILQGNCVPSENVTDLTHTIINTGKLGRRVFTTLLTVTRSERVQVLHNAVYKIPSEIL